MNTVVITYDPFAMESLVYLSREGTQEKYSVASNIQELAETAVTLAYDQDITDIKIHAPLAVYSEMKRVIEQVQKNNYNDNKTLNVEVI